MREKHMYVSNTQKKENKRKLEEKEEVEKLVLPEETFSYYDEFKPIELEMDKTFRPQFMYDAAVAVHKEKLKASQERFEAIKDRFWRLWAPSVDQEKRKMKQRPRYDLDIMTFTNKQERNVLRETSEMYEEALRRAARDAIEFASNIAPPTPRMRRLPELLKHLQKTIARNEQKINYVFTDISQTSSIIRVNQWIQHLKPYPATSLFRKIIPNENREPKLSTPSYRSKSKPSYSALQRSKISAGVDALADAERNADDDICSSLLLSGLQSPTGEYLSQEAFFTLDQLLPSTEEIQQPKKNPKLKVSAKREGLSKIKQEIDFVNSLSVCTVESKFSGIDLSRVEYWQKPVVFYRRKSNIEYDKNFVLEDNCAEYTSVTCKAPK